MSAGTSQENSAQKAKRKGAKSVAVYYMVRVSTDNEARNVVEMRFFGPFTSYTAAETWGKRNGGSNWRTLPLREPT
jgi:hypothetical protein